MNSSLVGVQPISKIDLVFSGIEPERRHCLLDTNILAAWSYKDVHNFGEEAALVFEKIAELEAIPFATVTTRSEFLDFARRVLLTENFLSMSSEKSKWRITEATKRKIDSLRRSVDAKSANDALPLFSDFQLKDLKRNFISPREESGKSGWLKICHEVLSKNLESQWSDLEHNVGLNYIDTQDESVRDVLPSRPKWDRLVDIIARSGPSSSDAMIVNMFEVSSIPVLISADFDVGYSFRATKLDQSRTILLPDKIAKEVNKLRF